MTDSVETPSPDRFVLTNLGDLGVSVDVRPYIDRNLLAETGGTLLTESGFTLQSKDVTAYTRVVVED